MNNARMIGHSSIIAQLETEKRYTVRHTTNKIFLTKMIAKKPITFTLIRDIESKGYVMMPCNYTFRSTVSHFDYGDDEQRYTRNKGVINSFLKTLKSSFIWNHIVNKDSFLKVNTFNLKSKKVNARKELKDMIT